MHKKIDHVPTVRRAPAIPSELAKQRRLRLQQLEDLRVDAAEAHAIAAPVRPLPHWRDPIRQRNPVTGGLIMITNCIIVGLTTQRPLGQRIGGRRSMRTHCGSLTARDIRPPARRISEQQVPAIGRPLAG